MKYKAMEKLRDLLESELELVIYDIRPKAIGMAKAYITSLDALSVAEEELVAEVQAILDGVQLELFDAYP